VGESEEEEVDLNEGVSAALKLSKEMTVTAALRVDKVVEETVPQRLILSTVRLSRAESVASDETLGREAVGESVARDEMLAKEAVGESVARDEMLAKEAVDDTVPLVDSHLVTDSREVSERAALCVKVALTVGELVG